MTQLLNRFDVFDGKAAEHVAEALFEVKPELVAEIDFGGKGEPPEML